MNTSEFATNASVKHLYNRNGYLCFLWMVVQQITVASSTYLIIKAMAELADGRHSASFQYLLAFGISLVLVYVPNALSELYRQRWSLSSFGLYLAAFYRSNRAKTTLFHAKARDRYETWVTHEGEKTYEESTSLLLHLSGTVLNALLNIAVIGIMVDTEMFVWYGLAGAIMILANSIAQDLIKRKSIRLQSLRRSLSDMVLAAWDNVTVGNQRNGSAWHTRLNQSLADSMNGYDNYNITKALVSSGTVSLAFVLICIGIGRFIYSHSGSIEQVSAMIVTLPRQVQIVQSIFMFFGLYLAWVGAFERLKELSTAIDITSLRNDALNQIKWDRISVYHSGELLTCNSFGNFVGICSGIEAGRLTIRGRNGSGKSALLAAYAESTEESVFYWPSMTKKLMFSGGDAAELSGFSDGQRAVYISQRLSSADEYRSIVLDEWDANLDEANAITINKHINCLAENKLVVEVRH